MFKKIVSNLTFSPALIGQLGFYAKRLKNEDTTRRLALIFTVLALLVQSLAVFNPSESANAASSNDMVYGGIGQSLDNFLKPYDANTLKIKDAMDYTGITREEIVAAKYTSWQAGTKLSWGFVPHFSYEQGERQHIILDQDGNYSTTIYSRPLSLWKGPNNTAYGWVGQSKTMGWFAIMQVCGNLVTEKIPSKPPVNEPEPVIEKTPESTPEPTPEPEKKPNPSPVTTPDSTPAPTTPIVTETGITTPKCSYNKNLLENDPDCKPCPGNESIWINDKICQPNIVKSKKAINITQNFIDSSSTITKAGEQIRYAITLENTGLNTATQTIEDNLSDILEYSSIIDSGGGLLDKDTGIIKWPEVSIESQKSQTRTYTVRLFDEIPALAQGKSDPTSYDCIMTNTFGNSINTKVECPIIKTVETIATELPTTGPGENILFACIVLFIAAYFFARTRQLEKEIRIIRTNSATGII